MLRQTMLGSLAAVLVAPALLVTATTVPAEAKVVKRHDWGTITATDGRLRKGCHRYTYRYDLHPPEGDWGLETFLVGPGGESLASGAHLIDHDPLRGTGHFTICQVVTKPGRFMVRGKLSIQNGPDEYAEGWVKPAFFKLRRP